MKTICPNCGCEHECGHEHQLESNIIPLQKRLHFSEKWMPQLRLGFNQAWRDAGAIRVSTKEVATKAFLSEPHTRRGLLILTERGEIERVGEKGGWRKLERFERSAV